MRRVLLYVVFATGLAAAAGCGGGVYGRQAQVMQEQRLALERENRELLARINDLDADNQRKTAMEAQFRREVQILRDQTDALQEQLRGATAQIARLKSQTAEQQKAVETLRASAQRRGGASITPNNSLRENLPRLDIPGVDVRRDGDLVRVAVPGQSLFNLDDDRLHSEGAKLLEGVVGELARIYPQQRIGIEGHTDNSVSQTSRWNSNHELSLAQATAVFEYATGTMRLPRDQFVVAGHGPSQPLWSNGTARGRERNRRIEFVIYPDRVEPRR